MSVPLLQELCIGYIIKNIDNNPILKNEVINHYFETQIFFRKHQMKMAQTLYYIQLVNNDINCYDINCYDINCYDMNCNNKDASVLSIKHLIGQDFFSYDHLLVTFSREPSKLVKVNRELVRKYVRCHSFIRL